MKRLILAIVLVMAAAGWAEAEFDFWKGWFGPKSQKECIDAYSEDVTFYRSRALIKQACQISFPLPGDTAIATIYSKDWAECILDEVPDVGMFDDKQALQLTLDRITLGCENLSE